MFAQAHTPPLLTRNDLDTYLEKGWFRMGQTIFTTNFIHFKNDMYSTIWLRILLEEYEADSTQLKLFKQNSKFKTSIKPAIIDDEKEELYTRYRESLPFQPSESLHHLLFGKSDKESIYTTYELTVYENNKLIACGFFDMGETSAEGITSFYDPAYKKYSLGKYLIYLKLQYCKDLKMRYFYPGYFVPGYSFFDYKLSIGRVVMQFLQLSTQSWIWMHSFSEDSIPYLVMKNKLLLVQHVLAKSNRDSQVVNYEFFDSNLIPELRDSELFDFPVFLLSESVHSMNPLLVVYDVRDGAYHLLSCVPIWEPGETNKETSFYSTYFLKSMHELYTTSSVDEIAMVFLKILNSQGFTPHPTITSA